MNVLNEALYTALRLRFGSVEVANPGQRRRVHYVPNWSGRGRRLRADVSEHGEEYRINCPFCNDRRKRCYVSHQYLVRDATTGSMNIGLFHCFNERCHTDQNNRVDFQDMIEGALLAVRRGYAQIPSGVSNIQQPCPEPPPEPLAPIDLPIGCVSIADLPASHPAAHYLTQNRGFNLQELAANYDVRYCHSGWGGDSRAGSRIVIPVRQEGQLMGWQARYVGEAEWTAREPKYKFPVGMKKSRLLYNIDAAVRYPVVVLCEGATDVWRVGPMGVAAFGKELSRHQCELLVQKCADKCLVIMLDADASVEAHVLWAELRDRFRGGVVLAELPAGSDPGAQDRNALWVAIANAARKQSIVWPPPATSPIETQPAKA